MATCLAETILATASASGFTKLSERDKLYVMLQSIYEASGSASTLDQLLEDARTAGFSKVPSERYKAAILLQLMISKAATTTNAAAILAEAAASEFMFLSEADKRAAFLQQLCDINSIDPDVASFLARSGVTDQTTIDALEALVVAMKADPLLWTSCVACYPVVGETTDTTRYDLTGDHDIAAWTGTVTPSSDGVKAGDTNSGGVTTITNGDMGDTYSISIYQVDPSAGGFDMAVSNYSAAGTDTSSEFSGYDVATTQFFRCDGSHFMTRTTADTTGLLTCVLNGGTTAQLYRRAAQLGADATYATFYENRPTAVYGILNRWSSGVVGNIGYQANIGLFAFFNTDVSSSIAAWNTMVEAFTTALGRNA